MSFKYHILVAAALTLAALMLVPTALLAQEPTPAADLAVYGNKYITLYIGDYYGIITTPANGQTTTQWMHGSYGLETLAGDPETTGDDYKALMLGFWKIKIGDQVRAIGDPASGSWTIPPTVNRFPVPGTSDGKTGGFIKAEWTLNDITAGTTIIKAKVNFIIRLVRDQVRWEVTATNLSSTSQGIGIEHQSVLMPSLSLNVAYPFLPGKGIVYYGDSPEQSLGTVMSGNAIPAFFDTYDYMDRPAVVPRLSFSVEDATRPDYVAIGDHDADFYNNLLTWLPADYTPRGEYLNSIEQITCWSPRPVSPNAKRAAVVTYAGCGAASSRWTTRVGRNIKPDSAVLAVQAPRAFKYDETTGGNILYPETMTITAYVNNLATDPAPIYDLENVTAVLYLPRGLKLAPGETAQKVIGSVPRNTEALPVSWQIQPTGFYDGELEYYVSVSDVNGWQQTVARKVLLPATKKSMFYWGYQLMHVPFNFSDPRPATVFNMEPQNFRAVYWDPVMSPANNQSYFNLDTIEPGKSFWIKLLNPELPAGTVQEFTVQPFGSSNIATVTGASMGTQLQEQMIDLAVGWNMIGNPFVYPVYWGQVMVVDGSKNLITLDQAAASGILSKTLFSWNPNKGQYDYVKTGDVLLDPWKGYWLRAYKPAKLVFRAPAFPESGVTAQISGF